MVTSPPRLVFFNKTGGEVAMQFLYYTAYANYYMGVSEDSHVDDDHGDHNGDDDNGADSNQ